MERNAIAELTIVDPARARDMIARYVLGSDGFQSSDFASPPGSLGAVTLEPHQLSAVSRLRSAIEEFGGALLSDPVGTGKTFVALAIAQANSTALVIAPAVLREMWASAGRSAQRKLIFASFESLSRGTTVDSEYDLVIVDEAHHARNPATARFRMLSRLASRSPVILLTATPIHNKRKDLAAILSLFLGERSATLNSAELARCVVRREHNLRESAAIPRSEELRWSSLTENDAIPKMLLSLPPPLPPRDGDDGGALVVHSLVRQWASSNAALEGALRRRLFRADALIAALEDGTWPSRSELESWTFAEDSLQLGFSSLLAPPSTESMKVLPIIRAHRDGVRDVLDALIANPQSDDERADLIQEIRARHTDRPVLVFSQYADTIDGMFRRLAVRGEVAALSGASARVAGGVITRSEAISRFAPLASGCPAPRSADVVSLLLTTDLLSEGVNLQDAGVVVHLDLPWTPARMEQRLGRIARMGSPYETVHAYAIRPPASAEAIVTMRTILDKKMRAAGIVTSAFPSLLSAETSTLCRTRSEPALAEEAREILEGWVDCDSRVSAVPVFSAVQAPIAGFVAGIACDGAVRLIACADNCITEDPAIVLRCLRACDGTPARVEDSRFADASLAVADYLRANNGLIGVRPAAGGTLQSRRKALKRISLAARSARPHERARILALAERARAAAISIRGVYAEAELYHLSKSNTSDEDVMLRISQMVPDPVVGRVKPAPYGLLVLILLWRTIALSPATER